MQAQLIIIGFDSLTAADFLAKAELIHRSLADHPDFPEPWPAHVPTSTQLAEALALYRNAYQATCGGRRAYIGPRNVARQILSGYLKRIAFHLETVARGDRALLATTGYDLRREHTRANGRPPTAPADFRLMYSDISGALVAKARKLPMAVGYQVQISEGDTVPELNWSDAGIFRSCSHIELEGLTPGIVYRVRIRAISRHGPGEWTPVASLRAL
jgi:hypothetical protein